ncbi:hypothetical protein OAP18_00795 [Gammaproteobacteria bacterium]|nr:hypothetical protein [Gammaproteobacteria bacterium]
MKNKFNILSDKALISVLAMIFVSTNNSQVYAQSTPSEFAEMSLQELFNQSIFDESDTEVSKWFFSYNYNYIFYKGYRDGSSDLSNEEVLFRPGEVRSTDNFPVLPTEIDQQVHLFSLGYQYSESIRFQFSLPYIKQATDHISIVPGYDGFLIESKGIGDVNLLAGRRLFENIDGNLWLTLGLSLPTGSIDEKGDTPRAPGNQQLPYTMQLGSGTYDALINVSYARTTLRNWNITGSFRIRSGSNDRDYKLGNLYTLSTRYSLPAWKILNPFVRVEYQYIERIDGRDREIVVPGVFPYPASITNPNMFGGQKANFVLGSEIYSGQSLDKGGIVMELGYPVYQSLNGPQPKTRWKLSLQYSIGF